MARARKIVADELPEEKVTDVAGLIAFMERLRANIPEEELAQIPEDVVENLDHYLYGSPKR